MRLLNINEFYLNLIFEGGVGFFNLTLSAPSGPPVVIFLIRTHFAEAQVKFKSDEKYRSSLIISEFELIPL